MTPENAIENLRAIPKENWAKIWCRISRMELPSEIFGEDKVEKGSDEFFNLIEPVMKFIANEIGAKNCNREYNRETMTDGQHEVFWEIVEGIKPVYYEIQAGRQLEIF